jgi:uncharacterized protein (TIGR03435 family)
MTRLLVSAVVVISCQAQSPAFEAASVKLNRLSGNQSLRWRYEPGRLIAENVTLRDLALFAYDVKDFQVSGGPAWVDSDRWDVSATAGREISEDERRRMLQTLLADRFQLKIRREMKDLPVYALVVAKNGPKLKANTDGVPGGIETTMNFKGYSQLTARNVPMPTLATILFNPTGRKVIDRTGIEGNFDFKLEWAPDPAHMPLINGGTPEGDTEGASIFTAVQEQLGLKLESTKGPVEVLVIERAERATEN